MDREELILHQGANQLALKVLSPYIQKIEQHKIRLIKIDLILNPRYDLTVFTDKKRGHKYLQAKFYWPDKNGVVNRNRSVSLGNLKNTHNINTNEKVSNLLLKRFGNEIK